MGKNLLRKIVLDDDLKATGINFTAAYLIGKLANVFSLSLFGFNLNQYNSVDHFAIGVGIGTFTYRKAGRGVKGILTGLAAATIFNSAWESFESGFNPYGNIQSTVDAISDIAIVYAGTGLSFAEEKLKDYIINRDKYPKGKEKWVL